jgi:hypothetical protein
VSEPFGFTVEYINEPGDHGSIGWQVSLPHQCERWRIDAADDYADPTTQQTALNQLDKFIAEAQQARAALAAGQQYPTKENPK